MEESNSLLLKRPINVRVVVTERWQQEVQEQLQAQINQVDSRIQQLEMQGQRAIGELKQQTDANPDALNNQIANVTNQVNQQKNKFLEEKNRALQQLNQVQQLELGQEVVQGQMESFFNLKQGDNIVKKLNVSILVKDGIVEEIRGEI
jgi:exonuclease VII large subunit